MEMQEVIREATAFIHRQYGEAIFVTDIAEQVYLSPSYFSKVFRVITGYTVKEYVNRYRLYRAAMELKETDKHIIAIAFESGFSSQQAMTKSFTQQYKTAPARFRRLQLCTDPFPPENLFMERGISMDLKQIFANVRYVTKESFLVIGIETDINYNQPDGRGTHSIGGLFERWSAEKLIDSIPNQVNHRLTYGMTHESAEDDTAKYIVCTEVSTLDNLPSGLIGRRFDKSEYAVFDTTLDVEWSGEFWRYFYKTWLAEQDLSQPEAVYTKKNNVFTRLPNYEVYDENFKVSSDKILIYAPILRK